MHKRKPYKCPAFGAEVCDRPMTVVKHQTRHVRRRPFARDWRHPDSDQPAPTRPGSIREPS